MVNAFGNEVDVVWWVGLLMFPVWLGKQIINMVQLVGASRALAKVDALNRLEQKNM